MNKVWFITGAGSGIGAGTAKAALRAGDRVVATGRNLDKLRDAYRDDASENLAFIRWASNVIDDYAAEGNVQEMWSPYHGTQPGDPAKLGDALVKIAGMENPPKLFVAGSDALTMITPAVEARLQATRADEELSESTDGSF
jgi:NAD(P)-dependent dehydrogenase (short-subunit alcohol dehydrogenase family)